MRQVAEDRECKGDARMLKIVAFELADRLESAYREIAVRDEQVKSLKRQVAELVVKTNVLEV